MYGALGSARGGGWFRCTSESLMASKSLERGDPTPVQGDEEAATKAEGSAQRTGNRAQGWNGGGRGGVMRGGYAPSESTSACLVSLARSSFERLRVLDSSRAFSMREASLPEREERKFMQRWQGEGFSGSACSVL